MDHIKVIESCRKALKVSILELTGVLEYWSIEKKDIKPSAITPIRRHSHIPKLYEIKIFPLMQP